MAREFYDPNFHPQFNYAVRPDFGGTDYDFVKEISRDKLMFFVRDRDCLTKVTIPEKSFLEITIEGPSQQPFLEAHYDFMGELTDASIWFRRCLDLPWLSLDVDEKTIDTYCRLTDTHSDLMVQPNLRTEVLNFYHCIESTSLDDAKTLSYVDFPLTKNKQIVLDFRSGYDEMINKVRFYAEMTDNILYLGFRYKEETYFFRTLSLSVNFGRLGQNATPGEVARILSNVFVLVE